MDRGTLKALKIYTNFGHFLGFSPYKFLIIPSPQQQQQQQQPNDQHEPNIKVQNWIENKDDEKDKDTKERSYRLSLKKILAGDWLQKIDPWKKGLWKRSEVEKDWKFVGGLRGKSSWWLLLFSIGLQAIYQMFLIFRSIQAFLDEEQTPKEKVKVFYLSGILFILNFAQVILILNYGDHDTYLNSVKNTVAAIKNLREKAIRRRSGSGSEFQGMENKGKSEETPKSRSKSIKVFIYATLALTIFVPMVRGSNVFRNPRSKLLITSLFSSRPEKLPILLKLLASAFHFHVAGFSAFVGMFLGVTLAWYVAAVLPIIHQSRLQIEEWGENTKLKKNSESQLAAEYIYSSYNMLSILQNNFKTVYGSVALLCELGSLYVVVLNIFLTVVHSNLPSLARVLGMIYLQKIFFSRLAEIHTASEGAIDSWRRNGSSSLGSGSNLTSKWFQKFGKSVRPLRISVGDFFYVYKTFMLTLMSITISQTVNLILLG